MTFRALIDGKPSVIEITDSEFTRLADKRLLKVSELMEAIGQSRTTVFGWTRQQIIPSIKVGRNRRYDLDAVMAALRARGIKAVNTLRHAT